MDKKLVSKKIAVLTIPIAITLFVIPSITYGAYPVYDSRVFGQVAAQVKKATEQINKLKQQIELHKLNLQNLDGGLINKTKNEIALLENEYKMSKKSMNSVVSGNKDPEQSFKDVFQDFNSLNPDSATYSEIKGRIGTNRQKMEESTFQITELVNKKQHELEASQKRIYELSNQISKTKGAKDLAQLNNLLQAETINSQNITNELSALKSKQTALQIQQKKLEDDAKQLMNEKTASDFGKAAQMAQDNAKKLSKQANATPTWDKLVEERGWR